MRVRWAVAAGVCALACAATASAATFGARPMPTWQTNGRVLAIAVDGHTVYIAGTFTQVEDHAGHVLPRAHVAAINATTGAATAWNPGASGAVRALAIGSTGTVYAGGDFTSMGGLSRHHLAAISPNGAVQAWHPSADGSVYALARGAGIIYVAGEFSTLDGAQRTRLGAVSTTNGGLASWAPTADGTVEALASVKAGTEVVAGGLFTHINGRPHAHLAELSAVSGAAHAWATTPIWPVEGLAHDASQLYAAGAGSGGHLAAYSLSTGHVLWTVQTDGNLQSAAVVGSEVVAGGHFLNVCTLGTVCKNPIPREHVLAVSVATGAVDTRWHPAANSPLGVFAVRASGGRLFLGGDFTRIAGVAQQHFAQFQALP
jgi:trimeric autotransporter adhesin